MPMSLQNAIEVLREKFPDHTIHASEILWYFKHVNEYETKFQVSIQEKGFKADP